MKMLIYAFVGVVAVWGGMAEAKLIRPLTDMSVITVALNMFEMHAGRFPTQSEGLKALIERPGTYPEGKHWERLLNEEPTDPWGQPYEYVVSADFPRGFGLYSKGPDCFSKSAGNDPDDWNSWTADHRGQKTIGYYLQSAPKILYAAFGALILVVGHLIFGHRRLPNKKPEQFGRGDGDRPSN